LAEIFNDGYEMIENVDVITDDDSQNSAAVRNPPSVRHVVG